MRLSAVLALGLSATALALPAASPEADPAANALAEPAPEQLDDADWGLVEDLAEDDPEEENEWEQVKAREIDDDSADVDLEVAEDDDSVEVGIDSVRAIEARDIEDDSADVAEDDDSEDVDIDSVGAIEARELDDDSVHVAEDDDSVEIDIDSEGAIEARSIGFTTCTVTASALKYRTCPSTSCTAVGQYPKGKRLKTKFTLLGNPDKWIHLENGYHVSAQYCKPF